MAHRLNTNKQFMIGNGILAFAVLIVVVVFVLMSLRSQSEKQEEVVFTEVYTISLTKGFTGDSYSVYINDSLLLDKQIDEEPCMLQVTRFDEQNALMIVDNDTENISLFDLSEKGGTISLVKDADGVKQLAQ